jgi:hypothetical protein
VAIEVETGTQIRKNRRQFAKKFNELKNQYHQLYIVLSDTNFKRQYQTALDTTIYVRKDVQTLLAKIFQSVSPARSRVGKRAKKPE